jgi:serine/threonine-protein phosphatase 2A regulatory subunit B
MWQRCNSFTLGANRPGDKDKVSSLLCKGGVYLGWEDGRVECYDGVGKRYGFQGFALEFDYLESCDVLEKVLAIERFGDGGLRDFVVVGNERNLKLWRTRSKAPTAEIVNGRPGEEYESTCLRECKNVHSYILNSLSLNNNDQYLISSDYLKVNLWRPDRFEGCFTVVDVKPHKYNDLVFVINSAKFNPELDTVFGYSTSSGEIHVNDLRLSSKSQEVLMIDGSEVEGIDSAVKSISDFHFIDANLVVARNLNSVTLYDQRNSRRDIFTTVLCSDAQEINSIYETDAVYARFRISCSRDSAFTGGFSNRVNVISLLDGTREEVEVAPVFSDTESKDKLKLVAACNESFVAVFDNTLVEYRSVES